MIYQTLILTRSLNMIPEVLGQTAPIL